MASFAGVSRWKVSAQTNHPLPPAPAMQDNVERFAVFPAAMTSHLKVLEEQSRILGARILGCGQMGWLGVGSQTDFSLGLSPPNYSLVHREHSLFV